MSNLDDENSVVIGHYKSMGCNWVFFIFLLFKTRQLQISGRLRFLRLRRRNQPIAEEHHFGARVAALGGVM